MFHFHSLISFKKDVFYYMPDDRWVFFIMMNDDTGGKKRSTFFTVYLSKEASCFFFVGQGVPFQIVMNKTSDT